MELLRTIPGIDKITAITIMSEIGEIQRFSSPKKLHSFAGLVPTIRNSGGHIFHGQLNNRVRCIYEPQSSEQHDIKQF